MDSAAKEQLDRRRGQMGLFGAQTQAGKADDDEALLADVPEWSNKILLDEEKEALGYYLTGHPLMDHEMILKVLVSHDTAKLKELQVNREVRSAGIITSLKQRLTKRDKKPWAIAVLEDLMGTCELMVFPDAYSKFEGLLRSNQPLLIRGFSEVSEKGVTIKVSDVMEIDNAADLFKQVRFTMAADESFEAKLEELKSICAAHSGEASGYLRLKLEHDVQAMIRFSGKMKIKPDREFVTAAQKLLGYDNVELMTSNAVLNGSEH